jgi:pilus assembly protein CpaE
MIAAVVTEDAALQSRLTTVLESAGNIDSVLVIPEYPDASRIRSLENTGEKYVAFIDFGGHSERAFALAVEINRSCPSVGAVALNVGSSQADLIAIVRAGVCEVLPHHFTDGDVVTAVVNLTRKLADTPEVAGSNGVVYAFLPAKPGSGASSLAAYSALACARLADSHPLLLDFDIRLGISSFVLKLDSKNSIIDALENAARMDETLWDQLVSEREKLDVLGSAPADFGVQVPADSFKSILRWARGRYSTVVVDLPGTMEDFEIATLQQAGTIFLVCGPDLTGLHMARRRVQRLHSLELLDRVCVVMNRVDKRSGLSMRDIESVLGLPVQITVPSDERSIAEAVRDGSVVSAKGPLGVQIEVIARRMAGHAAVGSNSAAARPKRKFVEFFSVPQEKGLDPWRL